MLSVRSTDRLIRKEKQKMSQFVRCKTVIRDPQCLVAALLKLGRWAEEQIEVHSAPVPLFGYQGDQRTETAEIIIRRQYVGLASNDLGFKKAIDGTYQAVISEYDGRHGYDQKWLTGVVDGYNRERIVKECQLAGYSYQVETRNGEEHVIAYITG
jgi:hypothetical protein